MRRFVKDGLLLLDEEQLRELHWAVLLRTLTRRAFLAGAAAVLQAG